MCKIELPECVGEIRNTFAFMLYPGDQTKRGEWITHDKHAHFISLNKDKDRSDLEDDLGINYWVEGRS